MIRKCIICETKFEARTTAMTCSLECRNKRRKERKRETWPLWKAKNGERFLAERRVKYAKTSDIKRAERRAKDRVRYAADRERICAVKRSWSANNPEKKREASRLWDTKNRNSRHDRDALNIVHAAAYREIMTRCGEIIESGRRANLIHAEIYRESLKLAGDQP